MRMELRWQQLPLDFDFDWQQSQWLTQTRHHNVLWFKWERSIINVFTDNLVSEIEHQIIWACHIIVFVLFLSSFVLLVFMSYNIVFTFIKVYSCFAEVWSNMTIKLITGKRKPSGPNLRIKDQSIVKRHLLENWKLHVVLYWIDKDWPASPIKNINIRSLCLAAFFPCHIRNKQWNPCKE